jgi:predicted P-loop ATPase
MLQCKTAGVAGVAYLPDHDDTGYKKAHAMATAAAKAQLPFIQLDPLALWSECPDKGDIADWVKWGMEQGWDKEQFVRRLEEQFNATADSVREEQCNRVDAELERNFNSNKPALKSKFNQRKNAVRELWGHKLRLNTLKQRVELDGEPLDLDFVRSELCELLDIDIPKEDAVEIVLSLARKNQYCPIVEYLERVELAYPDHGINFDSLISQLLGTSDPLHATYLKRHLIGSVARALNPGCKMDTALILQGEQGVKKSTFFQALYGEEMFDDTMAESSDKDELMKLHQHWVVEWAEFETTVGRKGYSRLKQFMSTRIDTYRPPYGRTAKAFARRTVLVGSTNESEFLNDPTGDRRFWVIPVSRIDLELTQQLRDRIWAAALQAYKSGEQWWLNDREQQLAADANEPYRTDDTWEQFILNYLRGKQFVTTAELLGKALEIEPAKQDRGSQMRAAAIIRRLGWRKDKRWHTGTWQRGWFAPDRSTDPPFDEVDRQVDRRHNLDEIGVSVSTDLPDQPFTPTFPVSNEAKNESKIEIQESLLEGGSVLEVDRRSNVCEIDISAADLPSIALTRADEETTQPPAAANIHPGQRVRFHLKGSKRDGMTAVVTARSADIEGNVVVRFDSCYQLSPKLQVLEASPNSLEVLTDG